MADTQFRLLGTDPVSRFFQDLAEQGHFSGRRFQTRQGIYICTPWGDLLASTRPTHPDSVLALMQRGLRAWDDRRETVRHPLELEDLVIAEDVYPVDGLVLDLTVRNLRAHDGGILERPIDPYPARSTFIARRLNFDHVWFSKEEALQWVPDRLDVGDARTLSDALVERIACLHLLDSVNSPHPTRFRREELGFSWIRTEVVASDGSRVQLRITGTTHAQTQARGDAVFANRMETRLLGYATFDLVSRSFDRFEAVALGWCAKLDAFTGGGSKKSEEIGFALSLAPPGRSKTPPHFLHRYDVDWVTAGGIVSASAASALAGAR